MVTASQLRDAADGAFDPTAELYQAASVINSCGTSGCVIGHYRVAHPEDFYESDEPKLGLTMSQDRALTWYGKLALYFGIGLQESLALFSYWGCGAEERAHSMESRRLDRHLAFQDAKAAAKYIRDFVARRVAVRLAR